MKYVYYAILLLSFMASTACNSRKYDAPFCGEVRNNTKEKFTEVAVKGKGYPGGFGNLVSGGTNVKFYYRGEILDDEFEVSWKDSKELLQTKMLIRPADFGESREIRLVVEFTASGDVKAYTEPLPD